MTTTHGIVTDHGFRAYLPLPKSERSGIGLCFSGGGYRATLFHAGAVRRLNELGILSGAKTITSVSGGSIMNAQLATFRAKAADKWKAGAPVPSFDEGFAGPLRRFTAQNIRTRAVLNRLLPQHWFDRNTASDELTRRYAGGLAPGKLGDLPPEPNFIFCATDINHRTGWVFDAGRRTMGTDERTWPAADWPIARATAASSCLPGAFTAMKIDLDGGGSVELTDGGIYDNLGLEPIWRDHAAVLVSDAGPSFGPAPRDLAAAVWRGLRYAVTLVEQVTDLRKRWLISNFIHGELEGAYWGMRSFPSSYGASSGYPDDLIADVISQFRIDLDVCSEGEIAVLENHGYFMADVAIAKHVPDLVADDAAPARAPHPDWMDVGKVRRALAESHKTKLFTRG
jgi:NTE family protein